MATERLVYECNREKCERCFEECRFTTDSSYAVEGDEGHPVVGDWEDAVPCQ